MKSVGKYGVVERALCDGLHGGLSCLLRLLQLIISYYFGPDNLNCCKENEMSVEMLIDFQFIRNAIIGITVNMMSYYCYQLLS
jgi:hypothetical protein